MKKIKGAIQFLGEILPITLGVMAILSGIPVFYLLYLSDKYNNGKYIAYAVVILAIELVLIYLVLRWLWPYYNADGEQTSEMEGNKH